MRTETSFIASLIKSGWSVSDAARAVPPVQIAKALLNSQASSRPVVRSSPSPSTLYAKASHWNRDMLERLVCEFCALFEVKTDDLPLFPVAAGSNGKAKEAFLRRVLDENVEFGDIYGVDAVIRSWLYVADVLADVRKQITSISVAGDDSEPILIVHMRNEFFSHLLESLMPHKDFSKLHGGKALCCTSKAQFHLTHKARISLCSFDSGFAIALQEAGLAIEETCDVLEWFSTLHRAGFDAGTSPRVQLREDVNGQMAPQDIPPKRRPKSNRERGQAFRLREKQREEHLKGSLGHLRETVSQLEARLSELQQQGSHAPAKLWGRAVHFQD